MRNRTDNGAVSRAREAWGDSMPPEIAKLAQAAETHGQNRIAEMLGFSRSTVSELINAKRSLGSHAERISNGLDALGYSGGGDDGQVGEPEQPVEANGDTLASDLGSILYSVEVGANKVPCRIIYREWVCAGHLILVAEAPSGRRIPFVQQLTNGGKGCEILTIDPDAGRTLAGAVASGVPLHTSVAFVERQLAAATLFFASDARSYL